MNKILLLSVKTYDFKNLDGTQVKGTKIAYLDCNKIITDTLTGFAPYEMGVKNISGITEIPGIYNVDSENIPGKGNKISVMFKNFKLIKPIDISKLF